MILVFIGYGSLFCIVNIGRCTDRNNFMVAQYMRFNSHVDLICRRPGINTFTDTTTGNRNHGYSN